MDGVFVVDEDDDQPRFRALPPPTRDDLDDIAQRVYQRTRELCIKLGRDWEEPDSIDNRLLEDEPLLAGCAESSIHGTALLGDRAGQSLLPFASSALRVPVDLVHRVAPGGFDLHASRRVRADDRKGLEKLCQYLLHPPLAHDRLRLTDDGRVRLRFARPWRNGVQEMIMEPLNFIARLVPLVPRPRTHQLRYHGVLAPRSKHRPRVLPERLPSASLEQLVMFDKHGKPTGTLPVSDAELSTSKRVITTPKLQRMTWARLLKRMGGWDMDACPDCGAQLVIVGVILDPNEVTLVLSMRGLLSVPQLDLSPARGPPLRGQLSFGFMREGKRSAKPRAA